jgi:excisionase family DNA binding protein
MNDYLSITDAARELGVNDRTVRRWIKSGELRASRDIVGRYRISRTDLEDFRRRRMERFGDEGDENDEADDI